MTDRLDQLVRLYALIGERLDSMPPYDYRNEAAVRRYREAADLLARNLMETEGAVIRDGSGTTSVRIAGIRATSTMGVLSALRNWRTACERKIMAGAA